MSGRDTRRMMNAKKPMSVSVTAAIAASRAGPSFVTRSMIGFTDGTLGRGRARIGTTRQKLPGLWLATR